MTDTQFLFDKISEMKKKTNLCCQLPHEKNAPIKVSTDCGDEKKTACMWANTKKALGQAQIMVSI